MICECGNEQFKAYQTHYHSVIVDGSGYVNEDLGAFDCEDVAGPFICTQCEKEYESLDEPEETKTLKIARKTKSKSKRKKGRKNE